MCLVQYLWYHVHLGSFLNLCLTACATILHRVTQVPQEHVHKFAFELWLESTGGRPLILQAKYCKVLCRSKSASSITNMWISSCAHFYKIRWWQIPISECQRKQKKTANKTPPQSEDNFHQVSSDKQYSWVPNTKGSIQWLFTLVWLLMERCWFSYFQVVFLVQFLSVATASIEYSRKCCTLLLKQFKT